MLRQGWTEGRNMASLGAQLTDKWLDGEPNLLLLGQHEVKAAGPEAPVVTELGQNKMDGLSWNSLVNCPSSSPSLTCPTLCSGVLFFSVPNPVPQ